MLLLSTLLLGGCFKPPARLAGTFAQISVAEAQRGALSGQRVRWGGMIVSTTPEKEDTCFEILARPLNSEARPRRTDESEGRFIACAPGFYDPAVYSNGRELTVVGTLEQPEMRKIGEHEYQYSKVAAEAVYLWPKREESPCTTIRRGPIGTGVRGRTATTRHSGDPGRTALGKLVHSVPPARTVPATSALHPTAGADEAQPPLLALTTP